MNKRDTITFLVLTCFSILAGYLLSAISLVGRIGIGLFYHEYRFLKVWWKGALIAFVVWMIIWIVQSVFRKKLTISGRNLMHSIFLIVAVAGLYFSFSDFRHTISHRWLGERFHLGVYLFWIVWIGITIYVWLPTVHRSSASLNNEQITTHI